MYPHQTIFDMAINWDSQRIPVKASERKKGPYPYYGAQGIVDYVDDYIFDGFYILVAEDGENLRSQKENVATLASGKFWVNNHAHVISSKPHCNTKYIFYALSDIDFTSYITGSTIPKLSQASLGNIELPCPSLEVQDAIASILGSLDDKIDLNRRTNETLEAMARALFRDWFVDFGPTRAKMAGEAPYLAPELWELFPDRLDDEEKPEEWETSTFDHCITILTGGTPKTSVPSYWNGNIPWFSVVDAPTESDVYVLDTTKKITQDGLNNSAASILPENTVIISARGTVGKLALTSGDMTMNQSCYGIRGSNGYGQYFILQALKNILNELKNNTHGSVFDTITRETFSTISTTLPSLRLAQHYENMVSKYFKRILVNCEESRTLSGLRDLLLPKLMSGEISIRDAEKMVEDVT